MARKRRSKKSKNNPPSNPTPTPSNNVEQGESSELENASFNTEQVLGEIRKDSTQYLAIILGCIIGGLAIIIAIAVYLGAMQLNQGSAISEIAGAARVSESNQQEIKSLMEDDRKTNEEWRRNYAISKNEFERSVKASGKIADEVANLKSNLGSVNTAIADSAANQMQLKSTIDGMRAEITALKNATAHSAIIPLGKEHMAGGPSAFEYPLSKLLGDKKIGESIHGITLTRTTILSPEYSAIVTHGAIHEKHVAITIRSIDGDVLPELDGKLWVQVEFTTH